MIPLHRFCAFEGSNADAVENFIRARGSDTKKVTLLFPHAVHFRSNVVRVGAANDSSVIASFRTTGHVIDREPMNDVRVLLPETSSLRIRLGRTSREIGGSRAIGLCPADENTIEIRGQNLMLRVNRSRVQSVMSLLDCDADLDRILNTHFIDPSLKGLDVLRSLIHQTTQGLDHAIGGIADLSAFKVAQDELLTLWVAQVLADAAASGGQSPTPGSGNVVRRCVEFIHGHAEDPISLVDLALEVDVSLRSMQIAFRRELSCTITEYIRRVRLDRACDMLRAAPPGTSVMGVALRCGFSHLGEFARHYRAAFGELPRDTLRRSTLSRT